MLFQSAARGGTDDRARPGITMTKGRRCADAMPPSTGRPRLYVYIYIALFCRLSILARRGLFRFRRDGRMLYANVSEERGESAVALALMRSRSLASTGLLLLRTTRGAAAWLMRRERNLGDGL